MVELPPGRAAVIWMLMAWLCSASGECRPVDAPTVGRGSMHQGVRPRKGRIAWFVARTRNAAPLSYFEFSSIATPAAETTAWEASAGEFKWDGSPTRTAPRLTVGPTPSHGASGRKPINPVLLPRVSERAASRRCAARRRRHRRPGRCIPDGGRSRSRVSRAAAGRRPAAFLRTRGE
jgi:hypothetical protein